MEWQVAITTLFLCLSTVALGKKLKSTGIITHQAYQRFMAEHKMRNLESYSLIQAEGKVETQRSGTNIFIKTEEPASQRFSITFKKKEKQHGR